MKKTTTILNDIKKILYSEKFKNESRLKERYFTRKRKVGFVDLIFIILNMLKRSTQLEIDDFLKRFIFNNMLFTYTKQSFSEARQKISPYAFKILNNAFIQKFYKSGYKTYKRYRLLAIDGTFLEIPNNKETRDNYGYVTNGNKNFKLARAISSKIYDLENDILVNAVLGRYDTGERELAIENIDEMLSIDSTPNNLILFDKAYPSIAFIEYLNSKKIKYFMKAKASFYKKATEGNFHDKIIEIEMTKERVRELKKQGFETEVGKTVTFRVLKIMIDKKIEIIITNLTEYDLSYRESISLYYKRWGIETKFNELKNKFQMENFSGDKPLTIEQDFYATVLLSNFASIIATEGTEKIKNRNESKKLKYRYKINKNILVGKLKNTLVEILLQDDQKMQLKLYEKLIYEIQRNIIPIIGGRNFEHKRGLKSNKYPKAYRRAV